MLYSKFGSLLNWASLLVVESNSIEVVGALLNHDRDLSEIKTLACKAVSLIVRLETVFFSNYPYICNMGAHLLVKLVLSSLLSFFGLMFVFLFLGRL